MVEMGWSPREFWTSTVPEFWCAVDWMAEKNAEIEEEIEEQRSARGPGRMTSGGKRGIDPSVNPDLWVPRLDGYEEWREGLRARGI